MLPMLQHNEAMDIRSKLTFVPCGHHLLFPFLHVRLIVFLLSRLFVYPACLISCHILCLPCLSCLSTLCLLHMHFTSFPSIACLPVSCFCLCMHTHGAETLRARAQSPRRKQKGHGYKHVVKHSGNVQ